MSLFILQGMCTKPSSFAIFALARTQSFRFIRLLLFSRDSFMRCLSCNLESSYRSLPARLHDASVQMATQAQRANTHSTRISSPSSA